jgi:sensor histidine kinase regulating citrate/malate metabolism
MRLSVRLSFLVVVGVALVTLTLAAFQIQSAQLGLRRDLERHALELAESLDKAAAPLIINHSDRELQRLVDRFQDNEGLAGVAIYDAQNTPLAVTSKLASRLTEIPDAVMRAAQQGGGAGEFVDLAEEPMHVFALPIRTDSAIVGTLAVFNDTGYIDAQRATIWRHALAGVVLQALVILLITWLVLRRDLGCPSPILLTGCMI